MRCLIFFRNLFHIKTDSLFLRNLRNAPVFHQVLSILSEPQNFLHPSHLQIDFCTGCPSDLLKEFLSNQSCTLTSLKFDSSPDLELSITPEVINTIYGDLESFEISAGLKRLRSKITDDCLLRFARQRLKIEKLRIQDAPEITPVGLIAIVKSWLEASDRMKRNLEIIIGSTNENLGEELRLFCQEAPKTNKKLRFVTWSNLNFGLESPAFRLRKRDRFRKSVCSLEFF